MDRMFELSRKNRNNGRRKFKLVLHEIYPDDCINYAEQCAGKYNANGISWIRQYCEAQIDTIPGTSLRVEFLDDERTEICGHGESGIVDGMPVFENATVIGNFTNGYIDQVTVDGRSFLAMIGEGEIDASCYPALVNKFAKELAKGNYPQCSVEITHTDEYETIQYLYGYKERGRIPTDFQYSGCALLGIAPADENACLLELNRKETKMTEEQIRSLVKEAIDAFVSANNAVEAEVNAAKEEADEAKEAADKSKEEKDAADEKCANLEAECEALRAKCAELETKLKESKKGERCAKLDEAIKEYSDVEKGYAQSEINAFNEKEYEGIPTDEEIAAEINSVVNAILVGIGKASKEKEAAEMNAAKNVTKETIDIFDTVDEPAKSAEEVNIF